MQASVNSGELSEYQKQAEMESLNDQTKHKEDNETPFFQIVCAYLIIFIVVSSFTFLVILAISKW